MVTSVAAPQTPLHLGGHPSPNLWPGLAEGERARGERWATEGASE